MFQVGSFTSAGLTAGTSGTENRGKGTPPGGAGLGITVLGAYGERPRSALCHGGETLWSQLLALRLCRTSRITLKEVTV